MYFHLAFACCAAVPPPLAAPFWYRFNQPIKFCFSVTDRWAAPKVKSQDEVLEEVGDRRISSSHKEYEKRRMSRIEERRAELEKLAKDKENEEKERLERIERRRQERFATYFERPYDVNEL